MSGVLEGIVHRVWLGRRKERPGKRQFFIESARGSMVADERGLETAELRPEARLGIVNWKHPKVGLVSRAKSDGAESR
jgi:hypothetical protein